MKILFVASEVSPFAKTGGLADVTGSLPRALKKKGHDVRIIMPLYQCVEEDDFTIRKVRKGVEITVNGEVRKGLLRQTSLDHIPVYLLENRDYFHRPELYGTPAGDYPDNSRRFGFFCRGVIELLKRMDFRPDVIHCHDWQTALIPVLLKYGHQEDPFYRKTALVYTIHNLAYQGVFEREALPDLGLDDSHFTIERLEFYNRINLMKGGILAADVVNTVSDTYCREIQTEEMGCGLEGVLRLRSHDLYGILNGIDYQEWNPATDPALFKKYTPSSLSGKAANKKGLQKALGLQQAADIPLLAMITRLSTQKGIDLLEKLLPRFARERLQLVILGTGDEKYMTMLKDFKETGAGNISIHLAFDTALSRRIYAGSDMFLMPSHYEPCGLGQLIALRYGSVPVVRKTGGLADTVFDRRDGVRDPNGFTFDDYTPEAFLEAITRALDAYRDRKSWDKMVRIGMHSDYSWEHSAAEYDALYEKALTKVVY
ncbi:MAG: glycogen synthase GlgA [Geobacteraceae bacterium]|nr:glycogen synthase GlgA [Geobacteraceae bacterium]